MKRAIDTVIGIDVGGPAKGFHAVALRDGKFEPKAFKKAEEMTSWCLEQDAQAIAIDAPCGWSSSGGSRLAERSLEIAGKTIQCFKTPTRASVIGRPFYSWVFHGETLYQSLLHHYQLFDGTRQNGKIVFETFPQAIACSWSGQVIPAHPKSATRRRLLQEKGYNDQPLTSIDFVDAALCAVVASEFLQCRTRSLGNVEEGFIVLPGFYASPVFS